MPRCCEDKQAETRVLRFTSLLLTHTKNTTNPKAASVLMGHRSERGNADAPSLGRQKKKPARKECR